MQDRITTSDAYYAFDVVKRICDKVGPGIPGSKQERSRAEMIKVELESHLGKDNVSVEDFLVAPGAFTGSIPVSAFLMLIAAILNMYFDQFTVIPFLFFSISALIISILSELSITLEFLNYSEFLDPLFRKKRSVNVIGTLRKPESNNIRRLLIISGHHDSAEENIWFRYFGYAFYVPAIILFIGINTVLIMCLIQLIGLMIGDSKLSQFGTIGWELMSFPILPAFLLAIFFTRGRKNGGKVPGAADNLSACALSAAMCRFLVQNPEYIPDETEIRFISFDSEEAGLRGSRRYVQRHLEELRRMDARVLNFETVAYPVISILTSDINGKVKNNPEMVRSIIGAADRAEVPYDVKPYPFSASDAGPFSRVGLNAVTLLPFKMPQQIVQFYHQKWDNPDILTIEPFVNVLKLTFEWINKGGE